MKSEGKKGNKKMIIIGTIIGISIAMIAHHFMTANDSSDYKIPSDINAYMKSCEHISYGDLKGKADTYAGKNIVEKGDVLQVLKSDDSDWVNIRLGTKDIFSNVIYVVYDPAAAKEEVSYGDTVEVWGPYYGMYKYKSTTGDKVNIPRMDAYHVKIINKY